MILGRKQSPLITRETENVSNGFPALLVARGWTSDLGPASQGQLPWQGLRRWYQGKMWSYWIRLGPNLMPDVLTRRGKFGHKETKGKHHVRMEAETGVVWSQAKDCWQPPEAGREAWDRPPSLRAYGRNRPCRHLGFELLASRST